MASSKLPWFPFYGFDFYTDERVTLLSEAEQGCYTRLLWQQWVERSVPADPATAAELIGAEDVDRVARLLTTFFEPNGQSGRLVNPKQAEIRGKYEARQAGKSLGGKRSARVQQDSKRSPSRVSRAREPDAEPKPDGNSAEILGGGEMVESTALTRRDDHSPVPADVVKAGAEARKLKKQLDVAARMVFSYACAAWGKQGTYRLDSKRKGKLRARLAEADANLMEATSQAFYVADGAKRDDWVSGRDPKSTRNYLDISTVYRDLEQFERLRDLTDWSPGNIHSTLQDMIDQRKDAHGG